jgi:threonyl-tRNA synthetase
MIIVGDKEVAGGTIPVRLRNGEQKNNISFEEFKLTLLRVIVDKSKDFGL